MKKSILALPLAAIMLAGCSSDDAPEAVKPDNGFRPATPQSSPYQSRVYEYMPAPGQFINETATGGFSGAETTKEAAIEYAAARLAQQKFVSLGAFGGYIVVGFDHSIANSHGSYDFAIKGNAMDTSNEPGIVWVMQDANRNGLPDDEWFELKGSEQGKPETKHGYSVTYYRPAEAKMPVQWTDSEGNSGTIDYLKAYHKQDFYYPAWVEADSYTLTGTLLQPRNSMDPTTGFWANNPMEWGYADNLGSDALAADKLWVGFKIDNAIKADATAANLEYIDFIKVQQGVQAKSGILGENSCEVFSFADYAILFK